MTLKATHAPKAFGTSTVIINDITLELVASPKKGQSVITFVVLEGAFSPKPPVTAPQGSLGSQ